MAAFLAAGSGVVSGAEWPAVEPKKAGDIRYVNGGAGVEEREAMPKDFPLKLVFIVRGGHFLNGVSVSIYSGSGSKVFEAKADNGPWLLVDLPAGGYRLEASQNGHIQSLPPFTVTAGQTLELVLAWKADEVDMGLPE